MHLWILVWAGSYVTRASDVEVTPEWVRTTVDVPVSRALARDDAEWLEDVVVDIAAMWLKAFVSPVFFWLHIPGGGLFAGIFLYVFFRALGEMWGGGGRRPH